MVSDRITPEQFEASEGGGDWRVLGDGASAFFSTRSFADAARFLQAIAELPRVEDHRPDVDVRHDGVTVRIVTMSDD